MATGSKGPENLTGTKEIDGLSRREALLTLGLTGLVAVTAACSADNPELPREQQQEPMPPENPSHDTSRDVVACDRDEDLIRVVNSEELRKYPLRYSLHPEDCEKDGGPKNVDPLMPAASASPKSTPTTNK